MAKPKSEQDHIAEARAKIVDAALMHVVFDGWTDATLEAAIADSGVDAGLARQAFPRGALDLAVAYHKAGDAAMLDAMATSEMSAIRIRDKIAFAVRLRLDAADKEAVQRGMALFALPIYALEGSRLLWGTADAIWNALGDPSEDLNWYTKRSLLSAVYSATVLYWLGDSSDGNADTWAFLDRRIENVMQFEKAKSTAMKLPMAQPMMEGLSKMFQKPRPRTDMPGYTAKD